MSAPTSRKPVRGARLERAAVASPAAPGKARGRWIAAGGAVLAAIGAIALWWGRGSPYAVTQTADQNVLLVTIDTLRADALGSYGGRAATPHLDRLAARRRALLVRARARGRDAALPHLHPDRPASLRARHARQQRLSRQGRDPRRSRRDSRPWALRPAPSSAASPSTKRFGLTPGFDVYDDQVPELKGDVSFSMPERTADECHQERDRLDRPPDHEVLLVGARVRSPLAVQAAARSRVAVRVATVPR